MKILLCILGCFFLSVVQAQKTDTLLVVRFGDSIQKIRPVKSRVWGNSTYISQAVNFSRHKEVELGLGRTYGLSNNYSSGLFYISMRSWGVGYSLTDVEHKRMRQSVKVFWEYGFIPAFFIGDFLIRGEYIYQLDNGQHYLRPAAGFTFLFFDVAYNYSFLLHPGRDENLYRHGVTLRLKQIIGMKKWESRRRINSNPRRFH